MTARVTVIHPWLPQYRLRFFEDAIAELAKHDVELTVAYGAPPPDVENRSDDVTVDWAVQLPTRIIRVGGRALLRHDAQAVVRGRDMVIAEQAIRNVETYGLVRRQGRAAPRLALWGHGRTYTKAQSSPEMWLKDRLTRRAHWFFAYTAGGAEHVVELGVPRERVTIVQNALDTESTLASRRAVEPHRIRLVSERLGLTQGRTALFVGALDPSKRLDVLIAAGRVLARRVPGFTLVVAGAGPLEGWLREHLGTAPWLRYVEPVFGREKAELAAAADLWLMPGRVGLAAVDSFALRLPIVTCEWSLHAPEFEYLVDGVNAAITTDSVDALSNRTVHLLSDADALARLRAGCTESAGVYTLDSMVQRFAGGVLEALERPALGVHRPGAQPLRGAAHVNATPR